MADNNPLGLDPRGEHWTQSDPTFLTTAQLMREITTLKEMILLHLKIADGASEKRFEVMTERTEALDVKLQALSQVINARLQGEIDTLAVKVSEQISSNDKASEKRFEVMAERTVSLQHEMEASFLSSDRAVEKANIATDKRFDAVNEFRTQLSDITGTMITRNEADAQFSSFDARIADIKSAIDKGFTGVDTRESTGLQVRESSRANMAIWISAAAVVLALLLGIITNLHIAGH
jgi:hypothetical protein